MQQKSRNHSFDENPVIRWGMTFIFFVVLLFAVVAWTFQYPLQIKTTVERNLTNETLSVRQITFVRNGAALTVLQPVVCNAGHEKEDHQCFDGRIFLATNRQRYFKKGDSFIIRMKNMLIEGKICETSVDGTTDFLICRVLLRCDKDLDSKDIFSQQGATLIREGVRPMENIFQAPY